MSSQGRNFDIGQVVYILSNKNQKIVPGMIVEEIVVKTLNGNQTTWKISIGPKGKERVVDHTKLDGEIHVSLTEIEDIMRKRLETFLSSLLDEAQQQSYNWYGKVSDTGLRKALPTASDIDIKVDPETLVEASPLTQSGNSHYHARNFDHSELVESEMVELDNGQKVKVNIKV